MEYRIKQGDDLSCSYTGKSSKVLIQLIDTSGATTQWLSREALNNADKLLRALEGIQEPIPAHPMPTYPNYPIGPMQVTCNADAPGSSGIEPVSNSPIENEKKNSTQDIHAARAFDQACIKLMQDPPPDKNGNQSGVPGFAVRALVAEWKARFSDVKQMYPVLQKHFQSPKEVVDFWLGLEK